MTLKVVGIIVGITIARAMGQVKVVGKNASRNRFPTITIFNHGKVIAEGIATQPRPDIEENGGIGFGFSLALLTDINSIAKPYDISGIASYGDAETELLIHKNVEFALQFFSLPPEQQFTFLKHISSSGQIATVRSSPRKHKASRKLAIITYANDAGAWFPYFYSYYSKLAGAAAIYVVTPKPESFSDYKLGGTITCSDMLYDDIERAELMSHFAAGLQAYYEWSLVCDVDEIVIPHPGSKESFFELLDKEINHIIISRGIDIIQMDDEPDFSFDSPVLKQRRFGIPNVAIYKPHLARIPIQYSIGYHYCNYKTALPEPRTGFVTLHLKRACRKICKEIATIIADTKYANEKIADYAATSVSEQSFDAKLKQYMDKPVEPLGSPSMQAFEKKYTETINHDPTSGLWLGKQIDAPFLVKLFENNE